MLERKKKRERGPGPFYNPIPPNLCYVDPVEMEELRSGLEAAHKHALSVKRLASTAQTYGPSTLLTALQTSDSEDDSSDGSSNSDSDDCDGEFTATSEEHSTQVSVARSQSLLTTEDFYLQKVAVTPTEAQEIEKATRSQADSPLWYTERRKRVTATLCKKVACRRTNDFTSILCDKLSGTFRGNQATRYGSQHEADALGCYLRYKKAMSPDFELAQSGLVIKPEIPWLAASPDALASDSMHGHGLVEVKCPHSCREGKTLRKAAESPHFCLKVIGDHLHLKSSHAYYYQVQHQLEVTEKTWVDFVVWTPEEMFIQRIPRDKNFFQKIFPKLKSFYFQHLLCALCSEK